MRVKKSVLRQTMNLIFTIIITSFWIETVLRILLSTNTDAFAQILCFMTSSKTHAYKNALAPLLGKKEYAWIVIKTVKAVKLIIKRYLISPVQHALKDIVIKDVVYPQKSARIFWIAWLVKRIKILLNYVRSALHFMFWAVINYLAHVTIL